MEIVVKCLKIGQETIPGHGHHTERRQHRLKTARAQGDHCPNDGARKRNRLDQVARKSADPRARHSRLHLATGNRVNLIDKVTDLRPSI